MPRIRTIKPEFPQSESMGRVSRDARLCFVNLFTLADDEGRLRGNSRMLASILFPYDDDVPALIDGWLCELEAESCIVRYQIDGANYLQICKWLNHQKIDKPSKSKFPPIDTGARIIAKGIEHSRLDLGSEDLYQVSEDMDQVAHGIATLPKLNELAEIGTTSLEDACKKTWEAYSLAFESRYGITPSRCVRVNSNIKSFCQSVAMDEAPAIAQYYVRSNHKWYLEKCHDVKYLMTDFQKLRTEWATGKSVSSTMAAQREKTASMLDSVNQVASEMGWSE